MPRSAFFVMAITVVLVVSNLVIDPAIVLGRGELGNDMSDIPARFADRGYPFGAPHGYAGHSSNLACSGDRFSPGPQRGLDVFVRIRA